MEALAFFAEALLEPDEERSVADHIETCALCATTIDELAGVTRALADAPAPALPQDVAALLDDRVSEAVAARAAEAPSTETTEETTPADAPATVTPIHTRRRRFGLPRLMMVAAASVFVIGGGAAVVGSLMSDGPETGSAAPLSDENAPASAPDTAQSYSTEGVASGTVYTEDGLTEQASDVLNTAEGDGGLSVKSEETSARLPEGAQECVGHVEAATGAHVTLVDDARWEGPEGPDRAWVLFTRDGEGVDVLVVDPSCAHGDDLDSSVLAEGDL
ncbi:hypothetical protein DSY14_06550 [Nocardiopsis sp. MG754419]|nr:hypothetical protein [Nocardiopsis sp. MG754419]